MRLRVFFAAALIALLAGQAVAWAQAAPNSRFDRVFDAVVRLKSLDDLKSLYPLRLTIDGRDGLDLRIMASAREIETLRAAGWQVTVLGRNDVPPPPDVKAAYHTYDTCAAELATLAAAHTDITELTTVATTVQGRKLWLLRITGDIAAGAPKPRLMFDATIHGDEWIAMEVAMGFIHELLDNYGTDSQVTALVDDLDIFVIPMDNPDGIAADTRENGNGVDLNRDFPYWWNTAGTWSPQPETEGLMTLALANNYVMGIDYHSGDEKINYVWDGDETFSPDNDVEFNVATVYQNQSGYEVINGFAWYYAEGTEEDFWHGSLGTTSVIVEISSPKIPPANMIATYVNKNVPSMLDWAALARNGVWGTVTDADTGQPIEATIFAGSHMPVHTNLDHGDFYKVLLPGTYDFKVWANGYGWNTIPNVIVPASGHVTVPIQLTADNSGQIAAVRSLMNIWMEALWGNYAAPVGGLPNAALGGPDGAGFTPGPAGWGVFDMGANSPVPTSAGWTLQVTTVGAAKYSVGVASDWSGPWTSLGAATGTQSFPLSGAKAATIRYVAVVDTSTHNAPAATAIDSIVAFQQTDDDDDDNDDNDDNDDDDDNDDNDNDDTTDDDTTDDDDNDNDDSTDDDTADDDDDSADDDASPAPSHHTAAKNGGGCGC